MRLPILTLTAVVSPTLTQAQAATALTDKQTKDYGELVKIALERDPAVLTARANRQAADVDKSALGAVNASAGFDLAGDFEQIKTPSYRLSMSVDLAALFKDNTTYFAALNAQTIQAGNAVRVRVLQAYAAYLYALENAAVAGDALEARSAEMRTLEAKAKVGAATNAEVLGGAERVSQGRLAIFKANLDLAVSKQNLASSAGVSLSELGNVLK